jgi:hypothetical protein
MGKFDFLFFDAGGGHRSAATALKAVIDKQQRPWQVRMIQVQDLLRPADLMHRLTGHDTESVYNLVLRKGWTLGSPYLVPLLHAGIEWTSSPQVRLLAEFWKQDPPDVVVSLIPNLNRVLYRGLRGSGSKAPYVTIITDLADYPPHTWIEKQPGYIICGSDRAVEQARSLGHPDSHIFRVSGMILRPNFYDVPPVDRAAERRKLNLDPDLPTGLVLFGGHGSSVMLDIAARVQQARQPVQLIMMCGHNEKLAAKLLAMRCTFPMHVVGFTSEVPLYMQISDFLIGKPGPGSVSEALAMKLPVIVERNAWTLPQERYNADWIREYRVGVVLSSFRRIGEAIAELLEPGRIDEFRVNAAKMNNRAVFEIPDVLDKVLAEARKNPTPPA